MKEKKSDMFIGFTFGMAALASLVIGGYQEANAEPAPLKPPVSCDEKQCTMTKEDYSLLVEYHSRVLAAILEWERREQSYQEMIEALRTEIQRRYRVCIDRRA